jgi:hypothetical protein
MVETLDFVARLRGESREHVAAVTTANAHRLFRLPAGGPDHQEERQDGRQ